MVYLFDLVGSSFCVFFLSSYGVMLTARRYTIRAVAYVGGHRAVSLALLSIESALLSA